MICSTRGCACKTFTTEMGCIANTPTLNALKPSPFIRLWHFIQSRHNQFHFITAQFVLISCGHKTILSKSLTLVKAFVLCYLFINCSSISFKSGLSGCGADESITLPVLSIRMYCGADSTLKYVAKIPLLSITLNPG